MTVEQDSERTEQRSERELLESIRRPPLSTVELTYVFIGVCYCLGPAVLSAQLRYFEWVVNRILSAHNGKAFKKLHDLCVHKKNFTVNLRTIDVRHCNQISMNEALMRPIDGGTEGPNVLLGEVPIIQCAVRQLSRSEEQRRAHAERERIRRRFLSAEQRRAHAERERRRRANMTPEQRRAHADRERARRASLTPEQRKHRAERERIRRAARTAEQRRAHAERERKRRGAMTVEQRKTHADREKMRRESIVRNNEQFQLWNQYNMHPMAMCEDGIRVPYHPQ